MTGSQELPVETLKQSTVVGRRAIPLCHSEEIYGKQGNYRCATEENGRGQSFV